MHKGGRHRDRESSRGPVWPASHSQKGGSQQRCRSYDAVGWFLPSLRAKLLALQLKFVHGEHHRAPQDRQASEPAALGLRPAV